MSLVLNTNIDSTIAQNNLSGSQSLLTQSLTRLSSGLRINSAADDAAGLAISNQFTTQINGTNQAINNANDAVSEAQTAAGALTTITNNLQSIRTLAVEAANGSNSASDRKALDQQVQQQIAEITQIAQQTTFNGLNVLNGSSGNQTYQVGANVGDTISINLAQGVGANQIGETATYAPTAAATAGINTGSTGALTIQVGTNAAVSIGASSNYATGVAWQDGTSAYAKAAAINAAGVSGLTATANTTLTDTTAANVSTTVGGTYSLGINGVAIFGGQSTTTGITLSSIVSQINQYSTQDGGVTATLNGAALWYSTRPTAATSRSRRAIPAARPAASPQPMSAPTAAPSRCPRARDIGVGGSTAADLTDFGFTAGTYTLTGGLDPCAAERADGCRRECDDSVGGLGARNDQRLPEPAGCHPEPLHGGGGQPASTSQNLTQSRSTIQDANFAQETANLTQAQVLEQAGISVLAQANQQPQLILKLLS